MQIKHRQSLMALSIASTILATDFTAAQVLEEVVVTARKRSEDLQDVPMAVSAFTGDQLQTFGVGEITDVARMTPNLQMNETSGLVGGAISVFMRGIGNDPGQDQGIGIYADDVYLNRTTGSLLEVFDVERIEVLKGPQGNLYGRNTIGGAVKYITREPGEELEGSAEIKAGSDSYLRVKGAVSGPLVDGTLYGGASFYYKERDGYQKNSFPGSDDPWSADAHAVRGTLMWTPSDSLKVKLAGDYSKDDALPPVPNRIALNERSINTISRITTTANTVFGPGTAVFDTPNDLSYPTDVDKVSTAFVDGYDQFKIEQTSLALTVEWDINAQWLLKSVTAGRFMDSVQPFDFDGSEQLWIDAVRQGIDSEDISQEFQLNFSGDTVNAVMGLYFLDGKQTQDHNLTFQSARLRAVQFHDKDTFVDDRDVDSVSLYANVDWNFSDDWQLSLGGRYTKDSKEEVQRATVRQGFYALALSSATGPLPLAIRPGQEAAVEASPLFVGWVANPRFFEFSMPENTDADDDWTEFTPSARLSHHLNDDTMVYGGVSTGFKSGGFNRTGGSSTAFDPETVTTYSLGLKTTLLDNSLRLNTELFYNDYTDKQLVSIQLLPDGNLQSQTLNVGELTTSGVEFEVSWLPPIDGLMINFNVGYLDTDVDSYESRDAAGNPIDIADTTAIGYAPKWTGQLRASYEMPIGDVGYLILGSDVSYQDEMFTNSPIDLTDPLEVAQMADDYYLVPDRKAGFLHASPAVSKQLRIFLRCAHRSSIKQIIF
ncbi:MAG: TonB-dependent receptor [Halioglobus sp.]|nr:TonB-dependent receptor [Halioglobus sp.]